MSERQSKCQSCGKLKSGGKGPHNQFFCHDCWLKRIIISKGSGFTCLVCNCDLSRGPGSRECNIHTRGKRHFKNLSKGMITTPVHNFGVTKGKEGRTSAKRKQTGAKGKVLKHLSVSSERSHPSTASTPSALQGRVALDVVLATQIETCRRQGPVLKIAISLSPEPLIQKRAC